MGVSNIMLQAGSMPEVVDSIVNNIGIDMFDEEIDDVIFQTNEFLTEIPDLRGSNHPENQSLGDLSHETNVLGGTKTGQN